METRYISTVDTAKIVKKILKDYWPGIKFSVRSDQYAGGSSLRVKWMDGPTEDQVKEITGYFEGSSFDGMQDLKTYVSKIELDENGNEIKVSYGPDFIFTTRETSRNYVEQVASQVIEYHNLDESLLDKIKKNYSNAYYWDVMNIKPEGWTQDLGALFHRFASKLEADKDGNIIKKRLSATYLKNLAAKAYAMDDPHLFTDELIERHGVDYDSAWGLYKEYTRGYKAA